MADKSAKLVVEYHGHQFYLMWTFPGDEFDTGGYLNAEDANDPEPSDLDDLEHWSACVALKQADHEYDGIGFFWESESAAKKALAIANRAIKAARSGKPAMPEWAEKALAAGWKPPKGWKP